MTNCVPTAQMVRLLLVPVVEPPENSCRMNRVLSIFLLLPVVALVICRGKPSRSVFDNSNVASWSSWALRRILPSFGPSCQDGGERLLRQDRSPRRCPTRWVTVNKLSDDAPQSRARWVALEFRVRCGDKHEYFSETLDQALVKAVVAPAARRAEGEDIVVAVFDVRRAYLYTEEKSDTVVELPDHVLAEFWTAHIGKLHKALYRTRPAATSWGDELR